MYLTEPEREPYETTPPLRRDLEDQSLRRYRNLADAIPHIVLRSNPEGDLEYTNNLWTQYTGLSLSQSVGHGWQSGIYADDLQAWLGLWYRAMRRSARYEAECRIRRYDGVYRWHWVKAEPELDEQGRVIAWLATCTDIQDRRTFEDQLREARHLAEAANHAKSCFLANMSHEIRTPLNAIMGFTELILDREIAADEKTKNAGIVRRNCKSLMRIVDEILDLSKVEAGTLTVEETEIPLLAFLDDLKTSVAPMSESKGISLKFNTEAPMPLLVLTDAVRLKQILVNLIGNAIKFTQAGNVTIETRFLACPDGVSSLRFRITDTGIGIERVAAEHLFQPFSQADSSANRLFGGTGLGLALSRKLARALGGDVRLIHSEPGKGSTFEVLIAAEVPPHSGWGMDGFEEGSAGPLKLEKEKPRSLAGVRILLVEDAEDNQFLIKQFLCRTGVLVDTANNGREGMQMARSGDYDIILMDLQMPLVDGYQATSELRASGYTKPIVALTAHARDDERERCLKIGCNGHLTKPISRQQLIAGVLEFTGGAAST